MTNKSLYSMFSSYKKEHIPALKKDLGLANIMAVPKLKKVVVNMGLGEALVQKKALENASSQLKVITGQNPRVTRAKQAISSFKVRAGDAIGLKVTLRGKRMYDFLTRLITVALPRVRDFRGVPVRGFDGRGGYTLGLAEITIFPELTYDMVDKVRGCEITIVTSAESSQSTHKLLSVLGIPFEKQEKTN